MTCSKLYVTKIKNSKSLQSQRTKGEIKFYNTSFNFTVILCIPYRKKKSRQKMTIFFASDEFFCRLFFFTDDYFYRRLIFIVEYSYRHFF